MIAVRWPSETVPHYRKLAAEARETAQAAQSSDHKEMYLKIARHWTELIREIEQSCGPHEIG